ncbi:SAM-dependent DNA methyltransferase, partial [Campylobacter sp. RM12920]|nr:SAM-dependent DNA methyltransferase [Campylobacter sp. RM12920]MBE2996040.1 SAM-dependent DNA methyltransferase [Campylobacter sp. RM6913]
TWFYRLDMPQNYKNFSKTKPMKIEHFEPVVSWWHNREQINENGFDKAKNYTFNELKEQNFNLDLCGFPQESEEVLNPFELIAKYQDERAQLNASIDTTISQIYEILQKA